MSAAEAPKREVELTSALADAARCAERVRAAIGRTPYLVKIGPLRDAEEAAALTGLLAR